MWTRQQNHISPSECKKAFDTTNGSSTGPIWIQIVKGKVVLLESLNPSAPIGSAQRKRKLNPNWRKAVGRTICCNSSFKPPSTDRRKEGCQKITSDYHCSMLLNIADRKRLFTVRITCMVWRWFPMRVNDCAEFDVVIYVYVPTCEQVLIAVLS